MGTAEAAEGKEESPRDGYSVLYGAETRWRATSVPS